MDDVLPLAANACGLAIGLVLGTFLHECGHALAGVALGCEPRAMVIGRGPIAFRRRWGRFWLVVRALPIGGSVASLPRGADRHGAYAGMVAAGPAANLVLFALLAPAFFGDVNLARMDGDMFVIGFAGAQLVIGATALFPHRLKVGRHQRRLATDGLKLYLLARGRYPDEFTILRRIFLQHPHERDRPLPDLSASTSEIVYQLGRRDLALEPWARADSIAVLRVIEADGRLNDAERTVVRTRLAIAEANPTLF